jgi:hypothetical protein
MEQFRGGFAAQSGQQVFKLDDVIGNTWRQLVELLFRETFKPLRAGFYGAEKCDGALVASVHHFTPVDSGETFVLQRCFGKGKLDVTCSSPFERAQKTLAADLSISVQIDFQVQLSIRQDIELTNHTPPDLS